MSRQAVYSFIAFVGIIVLTVLLIVYVPTQEERAEKRAMQDSEVTPQVTVQGTVKSASIDSVELQATGSFPVQVQAVVSGNFPDGCTKLHEINQIQSGHNFDIEVKTIASDQDVSCTQALVPFSETIQLDVVGLPAGEYTVDVNGIIAQFTLESDNIVDLKSGSPK